jgi:CheY-like chemotaxis protein
MTGDETILVVEDEASVLDLVRQVLVRAGYTVLTATNGREGLRLCAHLAEKIHLTLTDVVMPGMGGRAFAQQLVKQRPGTKILYMSGHTDDAIADHGSLDPGSHIITKPFSLTDLRRKVREVLEGP